MSDEQLAINAQMASQGKGGNLSDKQGEFVNDILSSYQMLLNLATGRSNSCFPGRPRPPRARALSIIHRSPPGVTPGPQKPNDKKVNDPGQFAPGFFFTKTSMKN